MGKSNEPSAWLHLRWTGACYEETGYDDVVYHDVPPELAAEARRRERNESSKALPRS
jgi:hypothetical protein